MDLLDYVQVSGIRQVPVVDDWSSLSRDEFERMCERPIVFRGLGADTDARKTWDHEFFRQFGAEKILLKSVFALGSRERTWTTPSRLSDFISSLEAGEEGVYAAEWYLFMKHPALLDAVIRGFPDYLLDDWLEVVPPTWGFGGKYTRNNVWWGAHKSVTHLHYDNLNACTMNVTLRGTKRWLLFSTRGFEIHQPRCWQRLGELGLLSELGLLTPEAMERYQENPPAGLAPGEFYTCDVPEGSTIYVPWRWAHQVQNIGETLAFSRFYVSHENYAASLELVGSRMGALPKMVFRLLGNAAVRDFLRSPAVVETLNGPRVTQVVATIFRLAVGA